MGNETGGADGAEVEVRSNFADGLIGLGVLGQGDEGAVAAEDASLFAGNFGDAVAEVVLVVEGDVGDDGEKGVDFVCDDTATAEADFQNGDVDRLCLTWSFSREVVKGEGREDLEEAWGMGKIAGFDEATGGFVHLKVESGEVFVGDLSGVDLDAFVDANQVRRGVEAGTVAGDGEDAGQSGGGGALAVGSSNQNGGEGGLGVGASSWPRA